MVQWTMDHRVPGTGTLLAFRSAALTVSVALCFLKLTVGMSHYSELALLSVIVGYTALTHYLLPRWSNRPLIKTGALAIDSAIAGYLLSVCCGLGSPFALYSFSPILLGAVLFGRAGAYVSAGVMLAVYNGTVWLDPAAASELAKTITFSQYVTRSMEYVLAPMVLVGWPRKARWAGRVPEPATRSDGSWGKAPGAEVIASGVPVGDSAQSRPAVAPGLPSVVVQYDLRLREREILDLVCRGMSNKEIASELHLAEVTVKKHMSNILRKPGCRNRQKLIAAVCHDNDGRVPVPTKDPTP